VARHHVTIDLDRLRKSASPLVALRRFARSLEVLVVRGRVMGNLVHPTAKALGLRRDRADLRVVAREVAGRELSSDRIPIACSIGLMRMAMINSAAKSS
jgi:hypothetical protein